MSGERGYLARAACPCCGASRERATRGVASTPAAEDLPREQHGSFASGYGARRVFFSYVRCGDCGALYCPVFYREDQLGELYGRQAENMAEVPLAARARTQHGYAQLLMRHSRGSGGFVEIGADVGLFARRCAQLGRFDHFALYEPNREVHAELSTRLAGRPHAVRASMRPGSELSAGSASTAALIHVLDHLLDPLAFLQRMHGALEAGGVLLLVTHNADSVLAKALGRRFPPYALQHPQLFTPTSLQRLLERAGFALVERRAALNYFPVMHLARAGLSVLGMRATLTSLQGPVIPIRLGNMAVIARKR